MQDHGSCLILTSWAIDTGLPKTCPQRPQAHTIYKVETDARKRPKSKNRRPHGRILEFRATITKVNNRSHRIDNWDLFFLALFEIVNIATEQDILLCNTPDKQEL